MYNALSEVNNYIKGGSNKTEKDILKIIHNAMSPKSRDIAHRYNKLEKLRGCMLELLDYWNQSLYYFYLRKLDKIINYDDRSYVIDILSLVDDKLNILRDKIELK